MSVGQIRCSSLDWVVMVLVVVVGGEQMASVPLAGLDRQYCPPQANSSNYTQVAIKVKGHDGVDGLVRR